MVEALALFLSLLIRLSLFLEFLLLEEFSLLEPFFGRLLTLSSHFFLLLHHQLQLLLFHRLRCFLKSRLNISWRDDVATLNHLRGCCWSFVLIHRKKRIIGGSLSIRICSIIVETSKFSSHSSIAKHKHSVGNEWKHYSERAGRSRPRIVLLNMTTLLTSSAELLIVRATLCVAMIETAGTMTVSSGFFGTSLIVLHRASVRALTVMASLYLVISYPASIILTLQVLVR